MISRQTRRCCSCGATNDLGIHGVACPGRDPKTILRVNAGAVESRRARSTKTTVTLYNNELAELDSSEPWSTVCENHGSICTHQTRATAHSWMACPEGWCEDCRELLESRDA
jgi:hypothetical protein